MRRLARWLDSIPHPLIACEIAADYVAAARWTRTGMGLDGFAVEPLPPGAIFPSPVESNVVDVAEVRGAGLLVAAVNELPAPQEDTIRQGAICASVRGGVTARPSGPGYR